MQASASYGVRTLEESGFQPRASAEDFGQRRVSAGRQAERLARNQVGTHQIATHARAWRAVRSLAEESQDSPNGGC